MSLRCRPALRMESSRRGLSASSTERRPLLPSGRRPMMFREIGPLPLPAKLTFLIGRPMRWDLNPEEAADAAVVDRIRAEVKDRLEQLILTGLVRREHPTWG